MNRRYLAAALGFVLLVACFGACGSRPGFEEDFTRLPEPKGLERELTDEEIERLSEEDAARRREMLREEMRLYIESEEEVELRPEPIEYRLVARDQFSVRFVNQPSMNGEFTVRPDGMVSFDLLGDLPVAGLTLRELARTLEELYAVYLRDPMINIVVRSFENQLFFVLGEVNRPGQYPLLPPLTLSQAIAHAGSWTDNARMENVMVIRMREDRSAFAFKVNLKEALKRAPEADPFLTHMDIVYVPAGRVASARNFTTRFFGIILPPIDAAWRTAILTGYR
ncbi:MAG: polysaccharide export protein [Candidatus Eisenbacteria bacterium]|nr:polysaccharide export protein [Candidatus Eisenbacteria bacterium]